MNTHKRINNIFRFFNNFKLLGIFMLQRNSFYKKTRIAIIVHIYYADLLPEFITYLKKMPVPFDLFITTGTPNLKKRILAAKLPALRKVYCFKTENRGRDMYPFTLMLKKVTTYDFVCKIHGKKSLNNPPLSLWRHYLLQHLLGSRMLIATIVGQFLYTKEIGIVFPKNHPYLKNVTASHTWGNNKIWGKWLAKRLKLRINFESKNHVYPCGGMFWFRPQAILDITSIDITKNNFLKGAGPIDGKLPHALERIFVSLAIHNNFLYKRISIKNKFIFALL